MVDFSDISTIRTAIDSCFDGFQIVSRLPSNQVLVTEEGHICAIYDLNSRSPVKSWSFPETNALSSPLVFDELNNLFIATQHHSILRFFGIDDELENGTKLTLKDHVHCVFTDPKKGAIIFFKNGCVRTLNQLRRGFVLNEGEAVLKSGDEIKWSRVCQTHDDVLDLFFITNFGNETSFYRMSFDWNNESTKKVHLPLTRKYRHFTLNHENKCVIGLSANNELVNISDEGELFLLSLPIGYEDNVNAIAFLSNNKLVLTLKNEQNEFVLEVWDLKFRVKISHQLLDLVPLSNCIYVHESTIFVCCTKGIVTIRFEVKNISLASVLGKMATEPEGRFREETDLKSILEKMEFSGPETREKLQTNAVRIILKEELDILSQRCKTFVDILKFPFSDTFLIRSLREQCFSVEEVLQILNVFDSLLTQSHLHTFLIDWVSILLDAYFKHLILSSNKTTVNTLKRIAQTIDALTEYCGRMQEMRNLVEKIDITSSYAEMNETSIHNVGQYCMEVVYL